MEIDELIVFFSHYFVNVVSGFSHLNTHFKYQNCHVFLAISQLLSFQNGHWLALHLAFYHIYLLDMLPVLCQVAIAKH